METPRKRLMVIIVACLFGLGFYAAGSVSARDKTPAGKSSEKSDSRKDSKKAKVPVKDSNSPDEMTAEEFEASLKYQRGNVVLAKGLATVKMPEGFRYLNPEQSETVLVHGWGNPPGPLTLGMVFPAEAGALTEDSWAVVITYQEDGYVEDKEAESIDYNDLLKQMQQDFIEDNKDRQQKGFEPVALIGWAATPHYDRQSHKLYWARELRFGDADEHTLNYDVRILGRKGVLSLNAVGSMNQLASIETGMRQVLGFVEFNDGNRYADFNPGADKIATYGIGALIAGKVLAKVGFFKMLLAFILSAKKLIVVALIGLGALLRRIFRRRNAEPEAETKLNLGG